MPDLAAVAVEWRSLLAGHFDLFKPFLRPLHVRAESYPRLDGGLPYQVVEHGPGDYVGVCPETGDVIALTTNQLIVYEMDRRRLAVRLAEALAIDPGSGPEDWNGKTVRVGHFTSQAGTRYSTFLAFPFESEDLHRIVTQLVADRLTPFVLLAPSRRWLRRAAEATLRSHGCVFVALADAVAVSGPGNFEHFQTLEAIVTQAAGVVSARTLKDGLGTSRRRGKVPHGHHLQFEHGAFVYKKARVELSGKPLVVLEAFAMAPGNARSAAELRLQCWEANSAVGDEAIRSHVSDARAALRQALKQAKVRHQPKFDPLPIIDRGDSRTAWKLQLP